MAILQLMHPCICTDCTEITWCSLTQGHTDLVPFLTRFYLANLPSIINAYTYTCVRIFKKLITCNY